ncbi:MAG: hypothetical protein ACRCXZ_06605 [Patescibacteria group bacterium]
MKHFQIGTCDPNSITGTYFISDRNTTSILHTQKIFGFFAKSMNFSFLEKAYSSSMIISEKKGLFGRSIYQFVLDPNKTDYDNSKVLISGLIECGENYPYFSQKKITLTFGPGSNVLKWRLVEAVGGGYYAIFTAIVPHPNSNSGIDCLFKLDTIALRYQIRGSFTDPVEHDNLSVHYIGMKNFEQGTSFKDMLTNWNHTPTKVSSSNQEGIDLQLGSSKNAQVEKYLKNSHKI